MPLGLNGSYSSDCNSSFCLAPIDVSRPTKDKTSADQTLEPKGIKGAIFEIIGKRTSLVDW